MNAFAQTYQATPTQPPTNLPVPGSGPRAAAPAPCKNQRGNGRGHGVMMDWQPFPVEQLPSRLPGFVRSVSSSLGCDETYVSLPLLSGLAAIIGNSRSVQLKPGWVEPASVWTAIVGYSWSIKSEAMQKAIAPLLRRQDEANKVYAEDMRAYQSKFQEYAQLQAIRKGTPLEPLAKAPPVPVCRRYFCSEMDSGELGDYLCAAQRGLLVYREELCGWFRTLEVGKGGGKRNGQNRLLCAQAAGKVLIGPGTVLLGSHVPLSICGGVQPDLLRFSLTRPLFREGLLASLLLAMPPLQARPWSDNVLDPEQEKELDNLFERLYQLPRGRNRKDEAAELVLGLSKAAKELWVQYHNAHTQEQTMLTGGLAAASAKLPAYATRLALLHWCVRSANGEVSGNIISADSMAAGIALARWFGQEVRRIHAVLSQDHLSRGQEQRELVDLIQRRGGRITARELRRVVRKFRDSQLAAEAALDELVDEGWGAWETVENGSQGGRPSVIFRLTTGYPVHKTLQNGANNRFCGPPGRATL